MKYSVSKNKAIVFGLTCALTLAGCKRATNSDVAIQPLTVQAPAIQAVPHMITVDLPGRIVPTRVAEVRARVAGIVLKRQFEEGSDVKEGQILYLIDSAPLRATLAQAKAQLAGAEAARYQAAALLDRYTPLVKHKAISALDFDNASGASKVAEAALQSAKAAVQTAELNLRYATVQAPISGRIGAALVTEGALVGQGEATPMARIQQVDSVYADLSQSVDEMVQVQQALAKAQVMRSKDAKLKVRVTLTGSDVQAEGTLLFSDISVDPTTGQFMLRARLPNPAHVFLPGMYVRATVDLGMDEHALLVPQQSVEFGPDGLGTVKIVDASGVVQSRHVTLGRMQGALWQVLDGLKPGEHVLTEHVDTIAAGTKVQLAPASSPPSSTLSASSPTSEIQ